ncbi:MAG: formate dehydrogenase subunit delta [Beijerinckiaceae bacterium]|nr:formate dehydrogenase subunit delta [Beijerinckiaceae bacterium]
MSVEKLVHMANQIAAFFKSQPDEKAVAGVADHIKSFWHPMMRREAYAHLQAGGEGLDPLARRGLETLMARDPAASPQSR